MGHTEVDDFTLLMESMRRRPRELDGPPPKIQLARLKEPYVVGYEATFKSLYNSYIGTVEDGPFYIELPNKNKILCTEDVYYLLKALLVSNVSYSLEYSKACTDLFTKIVMCGSNPITVQCVHSVVRDLKDVTYETSVLIKCINDLLLGDVSALFEWYRIASCTQLYPNTKDAMRKYIADNNITDTKSFRKTLRDAYKASKEDEKFSKSLVKGIPNREFIGALYLLHKEVPEVMVVSNTSDGFMS